MVLLAPNRTGLAQTYYYSTSCGYGSDAHVWRTKFADQYSYLHAKALNKQAIKPEEGGQDADFVETMAGGRTENQAFLYTLHPFLCPHQLLSEVPLQRIPDCLAFLQLS